MRFNLWGCGGWWRSDPIVLKGGCGYIADVCEWREQLWHFDMVLLRTCTQAMDLPPLVSSSSQFFHSSCSAGSAACMCIRACV